MFILAMAGRTHCLTTSRFKHIGGQHFSMLRYSSKAYQPRVMPSIPFQVIDWLVPVALSFDIHSLFLELRLA